ncbi:hypothetical protein F2Q68_00044199 [Brassica cretica]|uniref:Uncharacterized protein n=1 Tax=Brassica cretica TaxID=69181 RepID=A0A3N6RGE4_BRACR|nr:hypothetical protein F2Q68_00044199 [Brassica cretica]
MPRGMTEFMGLKINPSLDTFTFVDCSIISSERIIKDLQVEISDAIFPVDFHVIGLLRSSSSYGQGREDMPNIGFGDEAGFVVAIDTDYFERVKKRASIELCLSSVDQCHPNLVVDGGVYT